MSEKLKIMLSMQVLVVFLVGLIHLFCYTFDLLKEPITIYFYLSIMGLTFVVALLSRYVIDPFFEWFMKL